MARYLADRADKGNRKAGFAGGIWDTIEPSGRESMHLSITRMLLDHAPRATRPRRDGWRIVLRPPAPADYARLYAAVGSDLQWDERSRMPSVSRAAMLVSPRMRFFQLCLDDQPVGFAEFELQSTSRLVLRHFGIMPFVRGKGAGRYPLAYALRSVWHPGCKITLETDGNDHPNAVAVYRAAGFRSVGRRWKRFPD